MPRRATCGINLLGKSVTSYAGKSEKKMLCHSMWFVLLTQPMGLIVTALTECPGNYILKEKPYKIPAWFCACYLILWGELGFQLFNEEL